MSDDHEPRLDREKRSAGDDGLDWRELGQFAPRTRSGRSRPRCDLGPGGSLMQNADRARRLRQPERWHGIPVVRTLASAGGLLLTVALVVLIVGDTWFAVLLVLSALALSAAAAQRAYHRPVTEARLATQARNERRVAVELDGLAMSGWVLLHDRVLPGGEHRVAHVVVGPPGVFIVAPIPDTGPLRIVGTVDGDHDGRELYAGPLHLGLWLNTRRWELEQLEPAIASGLDDMVWTGPTAGIAVLTPAAAPWWQPRRKNTDVPDMPYEWNGIEFRPLSILVATLMGLPSTLDRPAVASLAGVVERLCPPAGRVDEPHDSSSSHSANKPG